MYEHVSLGMKLRRLLAALAGGKFRQDLAQQAAGVE